MEATIPELGPVALWSPKSSTFSGSDSIVVQEATRNFLSPRPSINKSREANFFIFQHEKVEASKLRCYLQTCSRALEQFLRRQTSSDDSTVFLLRMPLDRLVRGCVSMCVHRKRISSWNLQHFHILEKRIPLQGERAHSLYFLKNKIERKGGQNKNNRPINLPMVITFSTDYKYTT